MRGKDQEWVINDGLSGFPACPKEMTGLGDVILCSTTFPFKKFHRSLERPYDRRAIRFSGTLYNRINFQEVRRLRKAGSC